MSVTFSFLMHTAATEGASSDQLMVSGDRDFYNMLSNCFVLCPSLQDQEDFVIKPTNVTPPLDTSQWPLLLKVICEPCVLVQ